MLVFVSTLPQITYCLCVLSLLPRDENPNRCNYHCIFFLKHSNFEVQKTSTCTICDFWSYGCSLPIWQSHSGDVLHNYYKILYSSLICCILTAVSSASWFQPVVHCEYKLNNVWLRIRTFKKSKTIKSTVIISTCSAKLQINFKTYLLAVSSDH
jgi:hypothetical protein